MRRALPKVRAAARITGWVWFGLVALIVVGAVTLRLIGAQIDLVESASMSPAIPRDAVAITRPVEVSEIEVGDVITFRNTDDRLVLHRVVEVLDVNGTRRFRTKGDANDVTDRQLVHENDVERNLWFTVNGAAGTARALEPPLGFVWLGIVPAVLLGLGGRRERLDEPPQISHRVDGPRSPAETAPETAGTSVHNAPVRVGGAFTAALMG